MPFPHTREPSSRGETDGRDFISRDLNNKEARRGYGQTYGRLIFILISRSSSTQPFTLDPDAMAKALDKLLGMKGVSYIALSQNHLIIKLFFLYLFHFYLFYLFSFFSISSCINLYF